MINNISFRGSIRQTNTISASNKKIGVKNNTPVDNSFEKGNSAIAFKGNSIQKIKTVNIKNTKLTEFSKKHLTLIAGALGLISADKIAEINKENKLKEYVEKYPELMSVLNKQNRGLDVNCEVCYTSHYTDAAKIAVVEMYEKDPEKAYILAQHVKYDNSKNLTEKMCETIINHYEELKKYPSTTLEERCQRMNIVKENPRMENLAKYTPSSGDYNPTRIPVPDLLKYSEFCTDDEAAKIITETIKYHLNYNNNSLSQKTTDEHIATAAFIKEHSNLLPAMKKQLFETKLTDSIKSAIEKYMDEQGKLVNYVSKYGFNGAEELIEYNAKTPRHLMVASQVSENPSEVKDFIEKLFLTEDLFKEISRNNPELKEINKLNDLLEGNTKLQYESDLKKFISNLDLEKKELYIRISNDAKYNSLKALTSMEPLYRNFPAEEITEEKIQKYRDPLARAMKIY